MNANAADPGPHMCLAALEPCGCTAMVTVLGYGHDADAYRNAASEVKRGCRIEHMTVDAWKARGSYCVDHPDGPPSWKRNSRKVAAKSVVAPAADGLGL